ncbi:AmpG family muropeptide MFS transporter [Ignatzschineria sp. LJL83]
MPNFKLDSIERYGTKQNLSVALLGFSSGIPILMTLTTLSYWLSTLGIDKDTIGLATVLGLPYVLKFLWAPFLDLFQLPILGKLGLRKGWIVFFQGMIALILIMLSFINPKESPYLLGVLIFSLATASASQDIVIDAYRIDALDEENQAYGASSYMFMYRIAMLFMGAGVLMLSDFYSWSFIFLMIAVLVIVTLILTLFIPEKNELNNEDMAEKRICGNSFQHFIEGFVQFFTRKYALFFLLLVIFYKLPDAVSNVMVTPFYHEMGYTGAQIGAVSKIYGLVAALLGAFLAAAIINILGLYRSLLISAILIGVTNLGYLLIIYFPNISEVAGEPNTPSLLMLMIAISAENFISGFSSALFIMFLGLLCDRNASATQYALLSALAALGVRVIGGSSGFLVEGLGWENFFVGTAFLFIPSVLLIIFLKKQISVLKVLS